jgi:hypothetical protein
VCHAESFSSPAPGSSRPARLPRTRDAPSPPVARLRPGPGTHHPLPRSRARPLNLRDVPSQHSARRRRIVPRPGPPPRRAARGERCARARRSRSGHGVPAGVNEVAIGIGVAARTAGAAAPRKTGQPVPSCVPSRALQYPRVPIRSGRNFLRYCVMRLSVVGLIPAGGMARSSRSGPPRARITARSMTFCSSRMFPGHG